MMKNYNYTEWFYHIKPITDDLLKRWASSKDILISNPLKQLKDLEYYNKQGYNIYITFNSFLGDKRKLENINELKWILVDLDYKDWDIKPNYIEIRKKAKELEFKYWIFPSEINETANWYHLLYLLSKDLYYITNDIYLDISSALNWFFDWDVKAKQITWLRKLPWFIDHKPDIPFLIINKYNHPQSQLENIIINKNTLLDFWSIQDIKEDIFKKTIYWINIKINKEWLLDYTLFDQKRDDKIKKLIWKIEWTSIKWEIYNLIEEIDSKSLIEKINENAINGKKYFDNIIEIQKDKISIDNTNWLKLYYENGKHTIKDFAEKNRYGNRSFLLNYYFKINKEGISDKEKKERLLTYSNFLRNSFWIKLNKGKNNFFVSGKLLYDLFNNNIIFNINEFIKSENFNKYNILSKEEDIFNKNILLNIIYLYLKLENIRQEIYISSKKSINIKYKEILEDIWLKNNYNNRKKLKFYLSSLKFISIKFIKSWKVKWYDKYLWDVKFNRDDFEFISNIWTNIVSDKDKYKIISINKDIFYISKWFFNDKWSFLILLFLTYNLNNWYCIKIGLNKIKDIVELFTNNTYKDLNFLQTKFNQILKYAKNNKIILYSFKNKNTYTLWKSKPSLKK